MLRGEGWSYKEQVREDTPQLDFVPTTSSNQTYLYLTRDVETKPRLSAFLSAMAALAEPLRAGLWNAGCIHTNNFLA